jgi:hypothetical protein
MLAAPDDVMVTIRSAPPAALPPPSSLRSTKNKKHLKAKVHGL